MEQAYENVRERDTFGKWVVVSVMQGASSVTVLCECGYTQDIRTRLLLSGSSRQCLNCKRKENREAPFSKPMSDKDEQEREWEQNEIEKWLENNTPEQL